MESKEEQDLAADIETDLNEVIINRNISPLNVWW